MFLGSVASAGLFFGSLTTALLGSNATLPQNDPLDTEALANPHVAGEQVLPYWTVQISALMM